MHEPFDEPLQENIEAVEEELIRNVGYLQYVCSIRFRFELKSNYRQYFESAY